MGSPRDHTCSMDVYHQLWATIPGEQDRGSKFEETLVFNDEEGTSFPQIKGDYADGAVRRSGRIPNCLFLLWRNTRRSVALYLWYFSNSQG